MATIQDASDGDSMPPLASEETLITENNDEDQEALEVNAEDQVERAKSQEPSPTRSPTPPSTTSTPPLPDNVVIDEEETGQEDLVNNGNVNDLLGTTDPARGSLSPVSNGSLKAGDETDLSDLSLLDDEGERIAKEDLEDGEIQKQNDRSPSTKNRSRIRNVSIRRRRQESSEEREFRNSPVRLTKRGRGQPRTRSRSLDKRMDLPRYDVRYIIDRKRNKRLGKKNRTPSLSPPPKSSPKRRRRGKSSSRSRSRSRTRRRRSRSRSKSPLTKRRGSKSAIRHRRSPSRSPSRRRRRSVSRSPIRRRRSRSRSKSWSSSSSRSPPRRLKTSNKKKRKVTAPSKKKRKQSRSVTPPKKRRKDRSPSPSSKTKKTKKTGSKKSTKTGESKTKKKGKKTKRNVSRTVASDKEVFASGDNIMVSVSFKDDEAKKRVQEEVKNKEPSCVIDIMSSPYQVFEKDHEVVDVFSEGEENESSSKTIKKPTQPSASNGAKAVVEPEVVTLEPETDSAQVKKNGVGSSSVANDDVEPVLEIVTIPHKGPQTPPIVHEALDFTKGPKTPSDDGDDAGGGGDDDVDSYDPFDPTESPNDDQALWNEAVHLSANESESRANSSSSVRAPSSVSAKNNAGAELSKKNGHGTLADTSTTMDMEVDLDSPCSPHGSDLSDLFEPPVAGGGSSLTETPSKRIKTKSSKLKTAKNNNKSVQMKLVDDRLRIIDDVPTSAVEMAVKQKFLRKVQRQERIVDEIKMVLKPFYNKKKISKDSYKEIMRKCVPKVLHSKNGEINTNKIQKMVEVYVKKFQHREKVAKRKLSA